MLTVEGEAGFETRSAHQQDLLAITSVELLTYLESCPVDFLTRSLNLFSRWRYATDQIPDLQQQLTEAQANLADYPRDSRQYLAARNMVDLANRQISASLRAQNFAYQGYQRSVARLESSRNSTGVDFAADGSLYHLNDSQTTGLSLAIQGAGAHWFEFLIDNGLFVNDYVNLQRIIDYYPSQFILLRLLQKGVSADSLDLVVYAIESHYGWGAEALWFNCQQADNPDNSRALDDQYLAARPEWANPDVDRMDQLIKAGRMYNIDFAGPRL